MLCTDSTRLVVCKTLPSAPTNIAPVAAVAAVDSSCLCVAAGGRYRGRDLIGCCWALCGTSLPHSSFLFCNPYLALVDFTAGAVFSEHSNCSQCTASFRRCSTAARFVLLSTCRFTAVLELLGLSSGYSYMVGNNCCGVLKGGQNDNGRTRCSIICFVIYVLCVVAFLRQP